MISRISFLKEDNRTARAYKNILGSFAIKSMSVVINLALVPLTINYLSPTKYGVWLTISSMLGWISFFDIGLGHGLRNKLAESIAKGETHKAKSYVSTAYFSISLLCIGLFLAFLILNQFLNWGSILNIREHIDENLQTIALILFSMFAIQFVLQLINSILLSNQQNAMVSFYNMLSNLFVLLAIVLLTRFTHESLLNIAFIFSIIPVIVLVFVNVFYFRNSFSHFSPGFKAIDFHALREVLSLGIKFFIIQISVLVFFQTSNLLICRFFSPDLVTPYNISFRYFGIITMIFSIIIGPYWSAYTEAYVKQDFVWMRNTLKQLFKLWLVLVVIGICMLIFSAYAYHAWVGDKVHVDFKISLFMLIYTLITCFGNIYIMALNGIGKIRLQMIVNVIGMLLFVPLSYYLAVILHWGIPGIIISTTICSIYGTAVAPFEIRRILLQNRK
jgi:O-antigen/teichoic acid export membrane protein